jgi:formylglycine-generating enzyme
MRRWAALSLLWIAGCPSAPPATVELPPRVIATEGSQATERPCAGISVGTRCVGRDRDVRFAGGSYTMGGRQRHCTECSRRTDRVTVNPFSLDVTEVTVNAYGACVSAGVCAPPSTEGFTCIGCAGCNWGRGRREDHPVNCVDWRKAGAYCAFQQKRLPTEEEWEWAARGAQRGLEYPWGNEPPSEGGPPPALCWEMQAPELHGTCRVGSYPSGNSPDGLQDLSGNVREWTSTPADGGEYVVRGVGWIIVGGADASSAVRSTQAPSEQAVDLGFRCARDG